MSGPKQSRGWGQAWGLLFFATTVLRADDWPQYRGPNHDGTSTETIRTNWTEVAPRQLWQVNLGPALSSFAVVGGQVYTQVRRATPTGDQEFCVALNADSGAEIWATAMGIAQYPNGGVGADDGPRSTPTVESNRVYVLSSYLRLACLAAADGQVIWSRDLVNDFGAVVIPWQNAASPLLIGDLLYLNCNAPNQCLLALHKSDGSVAWQGQNDNLTQATPVSGTVAGAAQVIFFAQSGLVSVAVATGAVLWRYSFPFAISTAASPVIANDIVYCSAAYGNGAGAVRILNRGTSFTAIPVWRTPGANMNHWATPVFDSGYLYGVYGESLTRLSCINLTNGAAQWSMSGVGLGEVLKVSGLLLVSTDAGDLVLVQLNPAAYTEVDRFSAVTGRTWNVPAISNGRIYIRSTTQAAAYDVSPPITAPPPLRLQPLYVASGGFALLVSAADGSPLNASQGARINVFATSDLSVAGANWTKLTGLGVLTNGQLRVEDPQSANASQRFYRAEVDGP